MKDPEIENDQTDKINNQKDGEGEGYPSPDKVQSSGKDQPKNGAETEC